jgi:hypothetical protein
MNEPLSPDDQLADDVAWLRRHLGPADPIRSFAPTAPPALDPAVLTATLSVPATPRRRRARVAAAALSAAALVAAVVAVSATAGGGHGPTHVVSGQPIFAAAAATEAAHTAQVSVSVTSGSKVVDVQGNVDLAADASDFTAGLPMGIGTVEVRTIGSAGYVKVPSDFQGLVGGKPWVQVDLPTIDGLAGQQLGLPGLGGGLDVTGMLDWLRGVSGNVTEIGTDTIHGDTTTHYRANVDLTKAAAEAPPAVRAQVEQAAQAVGQTIPVDVWVDGQGRLRQLIVSVDPGKAQAPDGGVLSGTGPVVVTVDLWGFGAPVTVTAPPADQVGTLPGGGALRSVLGGGALGGTGGPVVPAG